MASCNRAQALALGDGYSLLFMHEHGIQGGLPSPKARSFDLPGDRLQYAPDRPADVKHVKLVIALDFEREAISGTAYTTFSALYEEVQTISFDAVELYIEDVALVDGPRLAYSTTSKKLKVTLDRSYQHGEEFTIAVTYHARPRTGLHFVKPAPEEPGRPVQAWTFGQPQYHSYWFPCHDAPNDRATTEIVVTVPSQFLTVSNGNLLQVTDNGATKTHHWRHDIPHAAYLVSLVVCDFAVIEDSYNGKPVKYYIRPDHKDDAPLYFSKTPAMMRFFSEYTGVEYPYDNYDQTVVEIYTGAMEHTSATTHSFALVPDQRAALDVDLVPVVAHELAHQWFGDLVTCRDWSNGWLNEGFATYFEELWEEHDKGIDEFKYVMYRSKQGYLHEDARYRRPIVYYVYYNQGFELFDAHLYNKGGWVLHMLRHQLGDVTFRRGIKAYLERYRTKEVITADLERTLEEVTGRSLARFFQQWVHSGGHPELEVNYSWDIEHGMARVKVKQAQKVDELTPCFFTPLTIAFTVPNSDEAARDQHTTDTRTVTMNVTLGEDGQTEQSFYMPLEREPLLVRIDPDGWLLKTLKFERSLKMLRYQLEHDPDVLGRIEAAEELGGKKEDESIGALAVALNNDPFWGVRVAAADALSKIGDDQAQHFLASALKNLDAQKFSLVREAAAHGLGAFHAPERAELASRSAQALRAVLEQGDISYRVEAACAEALGKTRTEGSVDLLIGLIGRPSWLNYVQRGIFSGLGASGDERVAEVIAAYLNNAEYHPTLRRAAAVGLISLGHSRHLYNEGARQRAVAALTHAVQHDSWNPARMASANALLALGEKSAASTLDRLAASEIDSGVQRVFRVIAHTLRTTDKSEEQLKTLRKDLDEVREENRKLRYQIDALEVRVK